MPAMSTLRKPAIAHRPPNHRASFGSDREWKKKKKKRSRKSLSELVNQIVEDSDSGIDAEGSDCDWEGLEMVDTFHPQPTPEGPKSLAKMSSGPVKSSHARCPSQSFVVSSKTFSRRTIPCLTATLFKTCFQAKASLPPPINSSRSSSRPLSLA